MDIDIQHLAHLARIQLSDEQKKQIEKDLPAILDFVGQLEEVDLALAGKGGAGVSGAEASRQLLGLENVFQKDEEHGTLEEKGQSLADTAPHTRDGFVEVPEVFKDSDPESSDGAGK